MPARPVLRYREQPPSESLRPFVECHWMVWDPQTRSSRPPDHIVPDGCPELIIHLGDPFSRRVAGRWRSQTRAFLAGTLSRPWSLRAGRHVRTLGIRFRPGAFTALFTTVMQPHTDREVPLAKLVPAAEARDMVARFEKAHTPAACFRVADAWLTARVPRPSPWLESPTRRAVQLVLRGRGQSRIEGIAGELGISRRRLERCFARDLGIRPKLYSRIVRLNVALATLGLDERVRMVDAALDAGYFDQAHLSRDFRAVAGRAATAKGRGGELSSHLTRPERLLAMLSGE